MSLTPEELRAIIREEVARVSAPRDQDEILNRAQVAELLGVEVHTVTRWVKDKGLPGAQLPGGEWRFRRSDVVAWMFEHRKIKPRKRKAA